MGAFERLETSAGRLPVSLVGASDMQGSKGLMRAEKIHLKLCYCATCTLLLALATLQAIMIAGSGITYRTRKMSSVGDP